MNLFGCLFIFSGGGVSGIDTFGHTLSLRDELPMCCVRFRTGNGGMPPALTVAPNARVRLRLVNLDSTRIVMLNLMRGAGDAEAAVIATDGNACDPFPLRGWRIGPAKIGRASCRERGCQYV